MTTRGPPGSVTVPPHASFPGLRLDDARPGSGMEGAEVTSQWIEFYYATFWNLN